MNKRLSILITGANRGIGLALTKHYISKGCEVICTCRNEHLASLRDQVLSFGGKPENVIPLTLDNSQNIEEIVASFPEKKLDILINNAALGDASDGSKFNKMNMKEWLDVFQVNTIAPILLSKTLFPFLSGSPNPLIIMITSHLASITLNDSPDSVLYGASKAALNSAVRRLAESPEFKSRNMTLGLVHPGSVKTRLSGFQGISSEASAQNIAVVAEKFNSGEFESATFIDSETLTVIPW